MIDGLGPYPETKPSGVPWLGDVPVHWDVRRLKRCLREPLRYGANAAAEHRNLEWPRYLRITDFTKDGRLREGTYRSLPPEEAANYLVEAGDLLLARSGATAGKAFIVPSDIGRACHAGYLIRARVDRPILVSVRKELESRESVVIRWAAPIREVLHVDCREPRPV